jgi:polar amino acid transport system substrate-binding protein
MKKILSLFVLLTSVFVLASCTTTGTEESTTLVYDRLDQEWVSRGEMKTIRVAMDLRYPPFETTDTNNEPTGISVELAYLFGEFIGRNVEVVNTAFGSIIPALQADEVDIAIASMSITEARDEVVDFSNVYFYFKIITLVNEEFAATNNITEDSSIDDLINSGGSFTGIANQVSASIPASYDISVLEAADLATAVENVVQGTADILLMSANPVVQAYAANPDTTMVVWSPWVSSPIGMAVNEGNAELQALANEFISTFNSGIYNYLKDLYDAEILETLGRFGLEFYINEN